jgi:hypothetical protein
MGRWRVDGRPAPLLDGCTDADLEASAFTNALPVNRLGLEVGQRADAPAAYVRALDLRVERLEQQYTRLPDEDEGSRYDYRAPQFDFACVLVYDQLAHPRLPGPRGARLLSERSDFARFVRRLHA